MMLLASLPSALVMPQHPRAALSRHVRSSTQITMVHPPPAATDSYSYEDPRTILDAFFGVKKKKTVGDQNYYTGFQADSTTGDVDRSKTTPASPVADLVNDSCIDWGALSSKEVAAAFVMLKGGRREEAKTLLSSVLADLDQMADADWVESAPSAYFQGDAKADPSKAKYYSGM